MAEAGVARSAENAPERSSRFRVMGASWCAMRGTSDRRLEAARAGFATAGGSATVGGGCEPRPFPPRTRRRCGAGPTATSMIHAPRAVQAFFGCRNSAPAGQAPEALLVDQRDAVSLLAKPLDLHELQSGVAAGGLKRVRPAAHHHGGARG